MSQLSENINSRITKLISGISLPTFFNQPPPHYLRFYTSHTHKL